MQRMGAGFYSQLLQGDGRMQHQGSTTPKVLNPQTCHHLPCPLPHPSCCCGARGSLEGTARLPPSSTGMCYHALFHICIFFFFNICGISLQLSALTFLAAMVMSTTKNPINNMNVPHAGPFMGPTLFDLLICKIFYWTTQLSLTAV